MIRCVLPCAAASVSIKGFAFAPATIDVGKGTTVTWKNEDTTTHIVTSGANRTKDNKFDFCQIHASMKATVTVK